MLHPIILLSFILLLPITNLLYTILILFILQKSMSFLVQPFNPKKPLTLISKYNKQITPHIYQITPRGPTLLTAKPPYQKSHTQLLYPLLSQNQLPPIKNILNQYHQNPFLLIHHLR
ncbi:YitT family protein, partial [Staphylococcus epidermidis]|uniref:YitT family protein n=1 Tax=Staphylococcus epidermidis TaxID=1282 RepID=UPI0021B2A70C